MIAAIDLGSNSFRLVIAKRDGEQFSIMINARERVQMARGLDDDNNITNIYWQRGLAAIQVFATLLKAFAVSEVRVVATNVFRVANNARDWVAAAEIILRHPIEIISGKVEAELIYIGAAHDADTENLRVLVTDIGGGSTEFAIGVAAELNHVTSCSMGCINYQKRFFQDSTLSLSQFKSANDAAKKMIEKSIEFDKNDWDKALGCSGTIGACHFLLDHLEGGVEMITLDGLYSLLECLLKLEDYDKLPLLGLSLDRKEIFPSGLAILIAIFEILGIKEMAFCKATVREGVLWSLIND